MYKPQKIIQKKMKVMEFIIYKTMLKVSNECVWLCVAIEPIDKIIPRIHMSVKRSNLYPLIEALGIRRLCKFLKLEHHLHSTFEKGIIEKTVQYVKDRI
jgi:putative transposase